MIEHIRGKIRRLTAVRPDLSKIGATAFCVAVFVLIAAGYALPRQVTVVTDDSAVITTRSYETTSRNVETFLKNHEIDFVQGRDLIDVNVDGAVRSGMVIRITKAFDIEVTADGETRTFFVLPATVGEVLQQVGFRLGEDDVVEPALDTMVKKGDSITVKRVVKVKKFRDVSVDYKKIYRADSSITIGDIQVTQEGRKGTVRKTYETTYVDGKRTDKKLLESQVITEARDQVVGYGTKISFGKPADLKYERKLEHVKAVSYYFSGNPVGCYGLPCEFGTVAVDRDLIPLGSLLYIEGYGYAIANDVGSAIKGKVVDLYMEEYQQCILWGARWTTVYVIDEA